MIFHDLAEITSREIVPGYHAKFVHSDNMTTAYWQVEKGAVLPAHAHIHEQIAMVIQGEFALTVNGETRTLTPGKVAVIPSNVEHAGKALTACQLVDIFHPVREEYR